MQWLIVPVVLAVLWWINLFPACPGFAYVILGVVYLIGAGISIAVEGASASSRRRDAEILSTIVYTQQILEQKNESLEYELSQIKRTLERMEK